MGEVPLSACGSSFKHEKPGLLCVRVPPKRLCVFLFKSIIGLCPGNTQKDSNSVTSLPGCPGMDVPRGVLSGTSASLKRTRECGSEFQGY